MSPEGKAADFGRALMAVILCCAVLTLCMKPALYIVIQALRFLIFSFLWVCDILMNQGKAAAELNPFTKLSDWSFLGFLFR